jgi:hypothetical protein
MDGSSSIVRWLPGAARLAPTHRAAGQQLDHLCGVHWASILLAADGVIASPEALAAEAGTLLPPPGSGEATPPGVASRPADASIPAADTAVRSGTAIAGLADAILRASEGERALVPLRADWTAERVRSILELCDAHPGWASVPLANLRTGRLWGAGLHLVDAIAYVEGADVSPPDPEWDVGHFVTIAGALEGAAGSLLIVRDSYPTLGWDGHHLQPAAAIAAALARGDGREGGIALYVAERDRPEVERSAKEQGFEIGTWDNGTPWPATGGRGARR